MNDLLIKRNHNLGIENARKITDNWIKDAEQNYGMTCTLSRDDEKDTVMFKRVGASGKIISTKSSFEVSAQLGFLFKSFLPKIEETINKNLDELIIANSN